LFIGGIRGTIAGGDLTHAPGFTLRLIAMFITETRIR
jgi:hypothetical protein